MDPGGAGRARLLVLVPVVQLKSLGTKVCCQASGRPKGEGRRKPSVTKHLITSCSVALDLWERFRSFQKQSCSSDASQAWSARRTCPCFAWFVLVFSIAAEAQLAGGGGDARGALQAAPRAWQGCGSALCWGKPRAAASCLDTSKPAVRCVESLLCLGEASASIWGSFGAV